MQTTYWSEKVVYKIMISKISLKFYKFNGIQLLWEHGSIHVFELWAMGCKALQVITWDSRLTVLKNHSFCQFSKDSEQRRITRSFPQGFLPSLVSRLRSLEKGQSLMRNDDLERRYGRNMGMVVACGYALVIKRNHSCWISKNVKAPRPCEEWSCGKSSLIRPTVIQLTFGS